MHQRGEKILSKLAECCLDNALIFVDDEANGK